MFGRKRKNGNTPSEHSAGTDAVRACEKAQADYCAADTPVERRDALDRYEAAAQTLMRELAAEDGATS